MKFKPKTFLSPEIVTSAVLTYFDQNHPSSQPWQLRRPPEVLPKAWSTLYFLTIGTGQQRRDLVVKIFRFPDQASATVSWQSEELLIRGRREYESLLRVYRHFQQQDDPRLQAVYPETYLPDINALVLDFVPGRPLYDNNLSPRHLLKRQGPQEAEQMLLCCGRWLRWFHRLPTDEAPDDRRFGPADSLQALLEHVHQLHHFGIMLEDQPLWEPALAALRQVEDSRRVWVHGDLHLRNFFLLPDRSVLSMDTALDRLDSPYLDLGKLLADLQTRRAYLFSRGVFPPRAMIDRFSRAFLDGYFAGEQPQPLLLAVYEGRFLIQKWVESLETLQQTFTGRRVPLGVAAQQLIVNPAFQRIVTAWMVRITQSGH